MDCYSGQTMVEIPSRELIGLGTTSSRPKVLAFLIQIVDALRLCKIVFRALECLGSFALLRGTPENEPRYERPIHIGVGEIDVVRDDPLVVFDRLREEVEGAVIVIEYPQDPTLVILDKAQTNVIMLSQYTFRCLQDFQPFAPITLSRGRPTITHAYRCRESLVSAARGESKAGLRITSRFAILANLSIASRQEEVAESLLSG